MEWADMAKEYRPVSSVLRVAGRVINVSVRHENGWERIAWLILARSQGSCGSLINNVWHC